MYKRFHHYLIAVFIFLFAANTDAPAQASCNCPEFEKLKADKQVAEKLLALSSPGCRAKGCELIAETLLKTKSIDSAEMSLKKSLAFYKEAVCETDQYKTAYKLLIQVYDVRADYQSSLDYNLKLLGIIEKNPDNLEQAGTLLNIAQVFNRMKQADKGIAYTRLALPFLEKLPSSVSKAELLNKVTARYFYFSQDFKNPKYADTAEFFVNQALHVSKEVADVKDQIIALTRMNAIAESRKNYTKAAAYIDEAVKMCIPGVHNRQLTTLYGDKGHLLLNMGKYREARRFADSCLHYCRLELYPPLIANAYSLIYEIENKAGNYKEALLAVDNEKKISDSLNSAERTKAINELEKKYNQAKNEKTISELAQQKKTYLLLAAAGLLALVAVGFFLRQQNLKQKQTILETEQRLNRARMNPHFFFNALATLQSIALKDNDGKALAGNLSKFSHIMRETLESTYKDYVTIEQETEFLNEYLELQKIRFPEKFTYSVHADEDVETEEMLVPSMILQPFVENSIEHGFTGISYPGHVTVAFSKHKDDLVIVVTDNGKGLMKTGKENSEHISRASQIIRDRIYLLNIKLKSKASFSIDNNPAGVGVMVKMILPVMYR